MAINVEELYRATIKQLPPADRLRLLVLIAQEADTLTAIDSNTATRTSVHQQSYRKLTIDEIIQQSGYHGGTFKTAAEVDAYIREERDSWGG